MSEAVTKAKKTCRSCAHFDSGKVAGSCAAGLGGLHRIMVMEHGRKCGKYKVNDFSEKKP